MSKIDDAYSRGLEKAKNAQHISPAWIDNLMGWARDAYPTTRDMDYWSEVIALDKERIANPPDAIKYPETRGLADRVVAERKGFLDGCGGGERELAFHYTWSYFVSRRLNTRHVGIDQRANHCTGIFIRETKEGGPIWVQNLDDLRRPAELEQFDPPLKGPDGVRKLFTAGVSSAVLCDEEPREIFPVDVWELMPSECHRNADDIIEFLSRYNEFWGPGNGIVADLQLNSFVFEKSNCRLGVRRATDGASATTACAYLTPEMRKFKHEAGRKSLEVRGWDESAPDWLYWMGCEARYERLLNLVDEVNARGATLEDVAAIGTDHGVPFPDRICLAGQLAHPDETTGNWTLVSQAHVMEGPNRRTLWHRVEGDVPCYENPPYLILGDGVEMNPAWAKNAR